MCICVSCMLVVAYRVAIATRSDSARIRICAHTNGEPTSATTPILVHDGIMCLRTGLAGSFVRVIPPPNLRYRRCACPRRGSLIADRAHNLNCQPRAAPSPCTSSAARYVTGSCCSSHIPHTPHTAHPLCARRRSWLTTACFVFPTYTRVSHDRSVAGHECVLRSFPNYRRIFRNASRTSQSPLDRLSLAHWHWHTRRLASCPSLFLCSSCHASPPSLFSAFIPLLLSRAADPPAVHPIPAPLSPRTAHHTTAAHSCMREREHDTCRSST